MDKKAMKLLDYLSLDHNTGVKVSDCYINTYIKVYEVNDAEYLILNDKEAKEYHEDSIQDSIDMLGIDGFSKSIQEFIIKNYIDTTYYGVDISDYEIDIEEVSRLCIEEEGRGYRIASYDNSEIKLDDNYYAYRLS